jgi:hypothetical protein
MVGDTAILFCPMNSETSKFEGYDFSNMLFFNLKGPGFGASIREFFSDREWRILFCLLSFFRPVLFAGAILMLQPLRCIF